MADPVKDCEQDCYDTFCSDEEKARNAATTHLFGFIPLKDDDVYKTLDEAAKDKYKKCKERCDTLQKAIKEAATPKK